MWLWMTAALAVPVTRAPLHVAGPPTAMGQAALALGDVNDDGFADVALGVADAGTGMALMTGEVRVYAGPSLRPLAQGTGGASGEGFGAALAIGDVSCDGVDDLVLSATGAGAVIGAGEVRVFFGPVSGSLSGPADVVLTGAAQWDTLGRSLAVVPDTDGDGCRDLVVGGPSVDTGATLDVGRAYVVPGGMTPGTRTITAASQLVIAGSSTYGQLGMAVAGAGDVDGDGLEDLLIGAPAEGPSGSAWLIAGARVAAGQDGLASALGRRLELAWAGASVGSSVDSADVDGDGTSELLIGAQTVLSAGQPVGAVCLISTAGLPLGPGAPIDLAVSGACTRGRAPGVMLGSTVRFVPRPGGADALVTGLVPVGAGLRSARPELWPLAGLPTSPWAPRGPAVEPVAGVTLLLPMAAGGDVDGDGAGDVALVALEQATGRVWLTVW